MASEAKAIVGLQYLLLPQTKVSFGNGHGAVVKQFHELDQSQLGVITVHVIDLPAECLS